MCNGDYLNTLAEHPIDDDERETTQQKTPGVADVRRRGFRALRNQLYDSIELASEPGRRSLVTLAVPPFCGLGFVGGQRWTSTANGGISARRVGGALRPREWS